MLSVSKMQGGDKPRTSRWWPWLPNTIPRPIHDGGGSPLIAARFVQGIQGHRSRVWEKSPQSVVQRLKMVVGWDCIEVTGSSRIKKGSTVRLAERGRIGC